MNENESGFGVVLFDTPHDAILGEKLIRDHLPVALMPIPSQFSAGCGIVMRFSLSDEGALRTLMETHQMKGRIEYVREGGGGG